MKINIQHANHEEKEFDLMVLDFLKNKYHFKTRLVDLECKELRENEINSFLRQAEIESDAVVCFMDMQTNLKYVSPAHDRLYGKKTVGQSNTLEVHPDDMSTFMLEVVPRSLRKETYTVVFRYRGEHEYLKVKSKVYPVIDDNGVTKAMFTVSNLATPEDELGFQ